MISLSSLRLKSEGFRPAVALTELMRAYWIEPPNLDEFDLSTLIQQILSVLAQTGGIRADQLFERLGRFLSTRITPRFCGNHEPNWGGTWPVAASR